MWDMGEVDNAGKEVESVAADLGVGNNRFSTYPMSPISPILPTA